VADAAGAADAAQAVEDVEPPRVTITQATPLLTSPEQMLQVTVTVENRAETSIRGELQLSVANDPFASRAALDAWTDGPLEQIEDETWPVKGVMVRLEAGQQESFTIEASAQSANLGKRGDEPGWGPRGVLVNWDTTTERHLAQDRTYVVYAPPETASGTVSLAVVAGLTAGAGELREPALARIARVSDATRDAWIAWALDSSLLTSADNEDPAATDRLAETVLEAVEAGKAVYGLPYQDIDEAVLASGAAGADQVVAAATALSDTRLRESLGAETAARISGGLVWAARPIGAIEAQNMAREGASLILADPAQFDPPLAQAVYRLEAGPVLAAPDLYLSQMLDKPDAVLAENKILADSAFAAQRSQVEGAAAALVVALLRDWDPDQDGVELLDTLVHAPWVEPVALAALANEPAASGPQLTNDPVWPGPDTADYEALLERIGHAVAFSSLTDEPEDYLTRALPPLLLPLSNSVQTGAARATAAQTALVGAATELPPVQVVVGSEVNLISDDGMVPVVVENQSNVAVTGLTVKLTAQTNAIRIDQAAELNLKPGQAVTARVPVHALANGVFDVQVELLDRDQRPVTAPASMTMRVRAEWENLGTAAIGALLGVVLVLGVISTARKRRAARRAGGGDGDGRRSGDDDKRRRGGGRAKPGDVAPLAGDVAPLADAVAPVGGPAAASSGGVVQMSEAVAASSGGVVQMSDAVAASRDNVVRAGEADDVGAPGRSRAE
jgi:hypothetical protein